MRLKWMRLAKVFLRACLIEEFEYRANTFANLLMTLFWLAMAVLTVNLYFFNTNHIGGWTYDEVLVLLGLFNAIQGFIQFFLQPNMTRLVSHIRKGTLDFVLTKPVDSMFYTSFRHLVFWRLADVALGLGLSAYALARMGQWPDWPQWGLFAVVFLASLAVVYSLCMMMMTLSFWTVKVDNLSYLFVSFFESARYPITVYGGVLRLVLTYVVPLAFITTVPAEALTGRLDGTGAFAAAGLAAVLLVLARCFWNYAVKHYTSASS